MKIERETEVGNRVRKKA